MTFATFFGQGIRSSRPSRSRPFERSQISIAIWGTGAFEWNLYSQDRTIVQRSTGDRSAPGTGQFPKLNERAFVFHAASMDKLRLTVRETGGVATTNIMAVVDVTPMM